MNLYGGVFDCSEFHHGASTHTDDWRVDIGGSGELRIHGDVKAAIDANVAAGQITGYDGEGTVVVSFVDGNTVVTALPPVPNTATNPDPPDRGVNIDPNVVLSWTPGKGAVSHDVYLGTDFDDVNSATTTDAVYLGTADVNHYPEAGPLALQLETTYYWRIDEKNASTYKGRVWHFTTRGPIIDPNMPVWYRLDEADGFVAHDSSGYGRHGAVDGPETLWDPDNGYDGGSRIFNEDGNAETVIDVPTTALDTVVGAVTVSMWLKDNYDNSEDNWVFGAGLGGASGPYHMYAAVPDANGDVLWRAGNSSNDVLKFIGFSAQTRWHHFAFTKDESADNISIYFDGDLLMSKSEVDDTLTNVVGAPFKLGAVAWSQNYIYLGAMDEFKVYDYALSPLQIKELFRGGKVELAWGPSPLDCEKDVLREVVLTWKPGDYATSHDVYFGTNFDDVNEGTGDTFKGNQALDANSYDPPGVLELNTTYYWRIDEVNDPCTWKGRVWSFTVANYLIVDDMESYHPVTNRIADTWIDGWVNYTGSEVSLGSVTDSPPSPVNGGDQSMIYAYDNGDSLGDGLEYYSEIERTFDTPQDWTEADEADVKVLTLYFYGDPDNDAHATEQMYVGLEDTRGTNSYAEVKYGYYSDEDMNDIKVDDWQEWNITLADFTGVTLEQVKKVYIGLGIRGNPNPSGTPGGSGTVYFDDIRLYPRKCVASRLKPEADINNDCVVDFDDLMLIADDWLDSDVMFDEVTEPSSDGLVGWWKLDEGSGDTAADSSPQGNNGTLEGKVSWVAGHIGPYALDFDGGRVLVQDAPELRPTDVVSVCVWVYFSDSQDNARVVVKGGDNHETFGLEVNGSDELVFHIRDVNDNRYGASEEVLNFDEWFHIAGTFDGDVVRSYINGVLADDNNEPNDITLSQDPNDFAIGNRSDDTDREFVGIIDDVRVYSRALSQAEIAYLATDGTGLYLMDSTANLYDKEEPGHRTVNFRDYAVLLEGWLEEKLWPPEE